MLSIHLNNDQQQRESLNEIEQKSCSQIISSQPCFQRQQSSNLELNLYPNACKLSSSIESTLDSTLSDDSDQSRITQPHFLVSLPISNTVFQFRSIDQINLLFFLVCTLGRTMKLFQLQQFEGDIKSWLKGQLNEAHQCVQIMCKNFQLRPESICKTHGEHHFQALETNMFKIFKKRYFSKSSRLLWNFSEAIRKVADLNEIIRKMEQHGISCIDTGAESLIFVNTDQMLAERGRILPEMEYYYLEMSRFIDLEQENFENFKELRQMSVKIAINELSNGNSHNKVQFLQKMFKQTTQSVYMAILSKVHLLITTQIADDRLFEKFIKQALQIDPNILQFDNHNSVPKTKITFQDLLQLCDLNLSQSIKLQLDIGIIRPRGSKQAESFKIEKVNTVLRNPNIFALKPIWNEDLVDFIMSARYNWDIFSQIEQEQFVNFTLILSYKVQRYRYGSASIFEQLYANSGVLAVQMRDFLGVGPSFEKIEAEMKSSWIGNESSKKIIKEFQQALNLPEDSICDKVMDSSFAFYFNATKGTQFKQYMVKMENKSKSLTLPHNMLADKKQIYVYLCYLRNVMSIFSQHSHSTPSNLQAAEWSKPTELLQRLHEEKLMETQCLGCSLFFYQNMNLLDQNVNSCPLKPYRYMDDIKKYEMEIKDDICAMLNSGGGIVMFGCERKLENVIAKGQKLSQKNKEEYEQRLMSYLEAVEPRGKVGKSVLINFVPLIQNIKKKDSTELSTYEGEESMLKPGQKYWKRPFVQGTFIMRVRISPCDSTTVFFWKKQTELDTSTNSQYFGFSIIREGRQVLLKMKCLGRQIKRKMKNFVPHVYSHLESLLVRKAYGAFDHECKKPQVGICQPAVQKSGKQRQNEEFLYASMIIVKKADLESVIQAFKSIRITVKIEQPFESMNLKSAKHTAIMYHNLKLDNLLLKVKNNPMFIFQGRELVIISITNYIKLIRRNRASPLPASTVQNLRKQIQEKFILQEVRAFEFKVNYATEQYYVKCKHHETTLLAYYLLKEMGEHVVFKNPLHIDRMDQSEAQGKLIEICKDQPSYTYRMERGQNAFIQHMEPVLDSDDNDQSFLAEQMFSLSSTAPTSSFYKK